VPQQLLWLSITHFLEGEELAGAMVSRGAQPLDKFCLQSGVGVLMRWRISDVLHLSDVLLIQLRYHVIEFSELVADPSQTKLCLRLGEPRGWPFCPNRQEPHGYSCYLA
jgi:hypothetical protein